MAVSENKYNGFVTRVMDGDTFEVLIELGFGVTQKFKVRLDGIDTPEMSTQKGKMAKEFVKDLIENKYVTLTDEGSEKYGRARASVELPDGKNLAQFLIEQKIGYEYHGEKKKTFAQLSMI
jgi:endonuclease YncB( thermonuclease family)